MQGVNLKTMISMDLKQQILHFYRVEEFSLREIARRTGADRKTVTRLVNAYEAFINEHPDEGIDGFLAEKPKYKSREYAPQVLREALSGEIDRFLKENDRRRNNGMRKQCLKGKDIHRLLVEKGYNVSYSSVCRYIRKKRDEKSGKSGDVFLKIHRSPGEECEFDWGEVKLFLDGKSATLMMAVFCFPYSKGRYAYLFHHQDSLAFMESHRNFFRDVNGVPCTMVYDNMKVAMAFDRKEKKPTVALQRMSNFYRYRWRFCNARAGWEKGNVERSVDYVRGRAFTTCVDFPSIEEAQVWLSRTCAQMNTESGSVATADKAGQLAEDFAALKPYPGEFGCFELAEYKADKQATVSIKGNRYSVPDSLAGKSVIVQLYSEKVVLFDGSHRRVAEHIRSYGTNQWVIEFSHFIPTLMKKTAAIEHCEAFHQMPTGIRDLFRRHFRDNGKEFLQLVSYAKEKGISYEDIVEAARLLQKRGVRSFTADHFKVALQTLAAGDETFREDQRNDAFIEIETGSEDILSQLECVMEKGTKLPK